MTAGYRQHSRPRIFGGHGPVYAGLFDDDLDTVADRMDAASTEFLADYGRTKPAVVGLDRPPIAF